MTESLTTQELMRPNAEDLGPHLSWWDRMLGRHQHCYHENPRHTRPDAGVLVRICCYCGRNEKSELRPAGHGQYVPAEERTARIWSEWEYWVSPEQWTAMTGGGMGY